MKTLNIILLCILLVSTASAEERAITTEAAQSNDHASIENCLPAIEFGGYLRNESAWHTGSGNDKDLVTQRVTWEEKIDIDMAECGTIKIVGQAYYDFAYDLHTSIYEDLPDQKREHLIDEDYRDRLKLKELHWDFSIGDLDLILGRQYVVWGESDGLPILDIVNPRDYTEFVFKDFIDQRIPLDIVNASYYMGDWSLSGVYIPEFVPEKYAEPGSEFGPAASPPGALEPDDNEENEHGFRLAGTLGDFDLSLIYLDVWDDNPTYFVYRENADSEPEIKPEHIDIKVYGGTFAVPAGDFILRGELAYYQDTYFGSDDPALLNEGQAVQKNYLNYMFGFDLEVNDYLDLTLQGISRRILDYDDYLQEEEEDNKATINLSGKLLRELLRPSLLMIYDLEKHDYFAKTQIAYDLADAFTVSCGGGRL